MNTRTLLLSLCLALGVPSARPASAQTPTATPIPTVSMRGTLTLNGCSLAPQAIELVADLLDSATLVPAHGRSPVAGATPVTDAGALDRLRTRRAIVTALPDGHSYTLEFRQLADKRLYRLSIGAPPGSCGKIFWRGPHAGLLVAGGASPHIEGFAARTQLEILALPGRPSTNSREPVWLGMDDLQFADAATATRTLRWRTDLPNVTHGELQVSTAAFPAPGPANACAEPAEGVIFRQRVPVNGREWAQISPIDFSRVLSVQRAGPLTERMQKRLLMGAPLYMRVVPNAADGPLCAVQDQGVHGQVVVAKLPPGNTPPLTPPPPVPVLASGNGQVYKPAYFPPPEHLGHPNYTEIAYMATKDHKVPPFNCYTNPGPIAAAFAKADPMGCVLVHTGIVPVGGTLFKGQWFYLKPNGSSSGGGLLGFITDTLAPIVTGIFNAAAVGVDFLSEGFEQIKNGVADVVVDVIEMSGLGPVCDGLGSTGLATCEGLVKTGLEVGLASMGVPPSIPSWEQVKQEGVDYLAAQLATEIAGNSELAQSVTKEVIKQLAEHALEQMTANRDAALGPQYDWLLPYFGFDPPTLTMSVAWTGSQSLPTEELFIERGASNLHQGGFAALPVLSLIDGSELRIPTALSPSYAGMWNPLCIYAIGQMTCTPNSWLAEPKCFTQIYQGSGPVLLLPFPCNPSTLAVYFRNAWHFRQGITQCIGVFASSKYWVVKAGQIGDLQISQPAPNPPFFDLGVFGVRDPAVWNGPIYVAPQCQTP